MDAGVWIGKFKTGTQGLVVFDQRAQKELPAFVLLFLLDDLCEQVFPAAAVRPNLAPVGGAERDVAMRKYMDWLSNPAGMSLKPRFPTVPPHEYVSDRGMPWLDDWGA